jgi:ribosomal protein L40E
MRCASCNHDNSADALFCDACGAKLESICATCGTTNQPDARFCKKCGTRIATESAPAKPAAAPTAPHIRVTPESSSPENIEGERKTVTALFADIKGSTELMEDLDPEEAQSIIDPALKLMIERVFVRRSWRWPARWSLEKSLLRWSPITRVPGHCLSGRAFMWKRCFHTGSRIVTVIVATCY